MLTTLTHVTSKNADLTSAQPRLSHPPQPASFLCCASRRVSECGRPAARPAIPSLNLPKSSPPVSVHTSCSRAAGGFSEVLGGGNAGSELQTHVVSDFSGSPPMSLPVPSRPVASRRVAWRGVAKLGEPLGRERSKFREFTRTVPCSPPPPLVPDVARSRPRKLCSGAAVTGVRATAADRPPLPSVCWVDLGLGRRRRGDWTEIAGGDGTETAGMKRQRVARSRQRDVRRGVKG